MRYRTLGKTGFRVSTVSFGAWAIGGSWGPSDDEASMAALHRAIDLGVTFFDTADVYGDGHSERLLARLRRERSEPFVVATKAGRRLDPHVADGHTAANLDAHMCTSGGRGTGSRFRIHTTIYLMRLRISGGAFLCRRRGPGWRHVSRCCAARRWGALRPVIR